MESPVSKNRFPLLAILTRSSLLIFLSFNVATAQVKQAESTERFDLHTSSSFASHAGIGDTTSFHEAYLNFCTEAAKLNQIRPDTFRLLGHKARMLSGIASYPAGMIRTHLGLGWGYIAKNQPDSSLFYFDEAKTMAEQIRDTSLAASACAGIAWASIYTQEYNTSLEMAHTARQWAKTTGDTLLMKYIFERIAKVYQYCQAPLEAYATWYDLHQICVAQADTAFMIKGYHILESVYADMQLANRQMNVVRKLLDVRGSIHDTSSLHTLYRTISRVYLLHHQFDSALYFTRLNLPYAARENKLSMVYTRLGRIYLESGVLDSARYYYQKGIDDLLMQHGYIDTDLWLDLGQIEYKSGHYSRALAYYQKAEAEISKPKLPVQRDIYKALYEYHKALQHPGQAFHYLEKYQWLADSITRFQNTFQAGLALLDLETAERENQIRLLTKDNELKSAINARNRREKQMIAGTGIMGLLMMSFGFYRFKKWKDMKAKEKLLHERLRISRDLHDEVGSTLTGIRMYSHLLRHQITSSNIKEASNSLDTIQASAGDMVEKLGDIVWLVHPSNDTLFKLLDKVKDYAQGMLRLHAVHLDFGIDPQVPDPVLPVDTRRNIYLIFKEGFHNAFKHSNASHIRFSIFSRDHKLILQLQDNGKGFDPTSPVMGNGLRNMRQRAVEISANLEIVAGTSSGTRMTLIVELPQ